MKLGIIRGYSDQAFDYVKSKGLDFTEICCNYDNETDDFINAAEKIKANIARTGVTVGSAGRWNALPNIGGKIDEQVFEKMAASIDTAASIGSPVFVCGINYDDSISLYKNLCTAVEYFGRLLECSKQNGIDLAIYNCDWNNFAHSPDTWKIILGELPDLMLKYDCSHCYNRGDSYLEQLAEWLPRVAHMHIKGQVKVGGRHIDDPPAGIDAIEWPQVFALLYANHYDKTLSIEPHSGIWHGELGEKGIDFTIDFVSRYLFRT